jgi:hypothetical protein
VSWLAMQYATAVCRGIKPQDRAALTAIAYHAKNETPHLAFCSQKRIADGLGVARSTAKASLKRLQAAGELELLAIGGIGKDKEHLATDWKLPGVEKWAKMVEKSAASGVKLRPQWGRDPIPGWGQTPIPIEDIDKRKIEDRQTLNATSLPRSIEKKGNEQSCLEPTLDKRSKQVSQQPCASAEPESGRPTSDRLPTGAAARAATGAVKAAIEAKIKALSEQHLEDDAAWFTMLRTVPEFQDIDVDHVTKKFKERRGDIVRPALARWLFTEDRTKHKAAPPPRPKQTALELSLHLNMYRHAVSMINEGRDPVAHFAETPFSNHDFSPAAIQRVCLKHDIPLPNGWSAEGPPGVTSKLSPQKYLSLEYLRARYAAGQIDSSKLEGICARTGIARDLVTRLGPPIDLMPDITDEDRRLFGAEMEARKASSALRRADEDDSEGWTGAANAEAFAAEMEPQLAGAGA